MNSLIEQIQQKQQDAKASAWSQYREIVGRNATPRPGDAEALLALAPTLGLTDADAERHAAVIVEDRRYDGAEENDLRAAREKLAATELAARQTEAEAARITEQARQAVDAAHGKSRSAMSVVFAAESRVERRTKLRAEHFKLFGLADPSAPRPVITKHNDQIKAESLAGGLKLSPEYAGLSWPALVALLMAERAASEFVSTTIGVNELAPAGVVLEHLKRRRGGLSPVNMVDGTADRRYEISEELMVRAARKFEKATTTRGADGRFVAEQ